MMHIRSWPVAAMAIVTLTASACKSDDPSAPLFRGTTVSIVDAPADGVLLQERALQLRASVKDADGADVANIPVTWAVSDEEVATITADGLITGLRLGEVEVRASGGGTSDMRPLSVRIGVPAPSSRNGDAVTSTLLDGLLRVTVPARALPNDAVLHVRLATDAPSSDRLVEGTAVELGPESLRFDESVTIALSYEGVPAGQVSRLRLYRADDDEWEQISSFVDPFAGRVRANISRAGTYAILQRPATSSLAKSAGDGQLAAPGASVAVAPRVIARDDAAAPVEGAVVRFSVLSGGGSIVGADSGVSDDAGVAALLGQWRLGPTAGTNALRAAVDGASTPAVTFNATATPLALPTLVVSHAEVNFAATVGLDPAPREVQVASSGAAPITALSVGPVEYIGGGATGWLVPSLDRSSTPAVLRLRPVTASLPANDYVAQVAVRSAMAGIAPSTILVRLGQRHGATSAIVVARQLSGAVSGRIATVQPRVEFRTAAGVLSPVSDEVTAALVAGLGTLRGATKVRAVNGVAAFEDLRVDGFGTHRLRFIGGGVSVDGTSFTVSQQLATLEISEQPSEVDEDRNFTVRVRLLDEAGLEYQPSKTVVASVASGPGELEGSASVTADDGLARFSIRIDDGTGPHTLVFRTSNPTLSVTSASIVVRDR